ncbi:MAG: type III-A CRISPR-associated protein Cas10/Csm1 [bacterium]
MMYERDRKALILGALLHDIGKFWERAREKDEMGLPQSSPDDRIAKGKVDVVREHARWSGQFILDHEKRLSAYGDILYKVMLHHKPSLNDRDELIIAVADRLASKERRKNVVETQDQEEDYPERWETPLASIFCEIDIGRGESPSGKSYGLKPLSLDKSVLFPRDTTTLGMSDYPDHKRRFNEELVVVEELDVDTLYYLLYKYLWCIPSATPFKTTTEVHPYIPDISLFDHLKVTTAIAACLDVLSSGGDPVLNMKDLEMLKEGGGATAERKLFSLLIGDISGIQNFIYAIAQPKAQPESAKGVAKRLRGRSFYIQMLTEVLARYILRIAGLPEMDLLYCGGGGFQILLPSHSELMKKKIDRAKEDINRWLFEKFHGELGIVIEREDFDCEGFKTWDRVLQRAYERVSSAKKNKFADIPDELLKGVKMESLKEREGIKADEEVRACPSCGKNLVKREEEGENVCSICEKHKDIGEILPRVKGIRFADGEEKAHGNFFIDFDLFGKVYLAKEEENLSEFLLINSTDFAGRAKGFRFLADTIPRAEKKFSITIGEETHEFEPGEGLDFGVIAE